MTGEKTYTLEVLAAHIARAIRKAHQGGDVVIHYVTFDTAAQEREEEEFFTRTASGGTKISSGAQCTIDCISRNYPPNEWNNFVFFFSDGENESGDMDTLENIFAELSRIANLMAYFEIFPSTYSGVGVGTVAMADRLMQLFDNFLISIMANESEVKNSWYDLVAKVREIELKRGKGAESNG